MLGFAGHLSTLIIEQLCFKKHYKSQKTLKKRKLAYFARVK